MSVQPVQELQIFSLGLYCFVFEVPQVSGKNKYTVKKI